MTRFVTPLAGRSCGETEYTAGLNGGGVRSSLPAVSQAVGEISIMDATGNRPTMLGYDVDLAALFLCLRQRWRLIGGGALGAVLLALVYLHIADYTYTATLMVSPVMSSSSDNMAGKLGGLKGLASLAGVNIGDNLGTQDFMLYQAGLYSRDVADELAKNPVVMHTVFASQWDGAAKQWSQPSGLMQGVVAVVKGAIGIPGQPWQPPGGAVLQEYIADNVAVAADTEKPIVTISYRDKSQWFAAYFLRELDRAVDNKLRTNALTRAQQYSAYLSDQLTKITNADVREALMSTLSEQEKIKMMASATAPYAAQPFGNPSASRKPASPKPLLVMIAAVFIGVSLGVVGALWLGWRQR
jgi:hypothetical protein